MATKKAGTVKKTVDKAYKKRLEDRLDELKWLYMEIYQGKTAEFDNLLNAMEDYYKNRPAYLRELDEVREKTPDWYRKNQLVGTMLYTENFGGNLKGVKSHLDYLKKSGMNYIHLMPLLDTTDGKSDGGYAVKNYRKVKPELGTMEDLADLTKACHDMDMCVCLDYVMNHTSEDHEWAIKARQGQKQYMDMYYFYDDYSIPAEFEKTVPQVFPKTAPGNFTYLPDMNKHVMTSFYPYQWDLNYWNPVVFNEMAFNMLFLANQGIDVIRIDAVPYIWKELGTNCRNLPKVHNVVRMMRLISEIVCPGVLLLGEVVMEPKELAPYFGTTERPECHMLYNATTMCTLWHTVATRDVRLLRHQTNQVVGLPKEYSFINYIRCHDDIGWGLDFNFLKQFGVKEPEHKEYINDFFLGNTWDSVSTGELYNADPVTRDARFCGTTASMCGIERGGFEGNEAKVSRGIDLDLMLHAFILFQSGIPVIYSGDEIGAINDWDYKKDPLKCEDSRYIHRGKFNWDNAKKIDEKGSVQQRIHSGLLKLEGIRRGNELFCGDADVYTIETHNDKVLGMIRIKDGKKLIGIFNFADSVTTAYVIELRDGYRNMLTGRPVAKRDDIILQPYEFIWASC